MHGTTIAFDVYFFYARLGKDINTFLFVVHHHGLADFLIFNGKNTIHEFYNGYFGADGMIEIRKFHSDCATSYDNHFFGLLGKHHSLAVTHYMGSVDRNIR